MDPVTLAVLMRLIGLGFGLQGDRQAADALSALATMVASGGSIDRHMADIERRLAANERPDWNGIRGSIAAESARFRDG